MSDTRDAQPKSELERRKFLAGSAATLAGLAIGGHWVWKAVQPNDAQTPVAGGIQAASVLSKAHFSPLVGQEFVLSADGCQRRLKLARVQAFGMRYPSGQREAFSILLESDAQEVALDGIYRLSHPKLGAHDLFLACVGKHGRVLEAIFT